MKITRVLPVATCLSALVACGSPSPQDAAIDNNAAALEDSLEHAADNLDAMASNTADQSAADAMKNAADDLESMKGNVADAAHAAKRDLRH